MAAHRPLRLLLGLVRSENEKITRYCDRVTDGFPCKQRGSRFKRNLIEKQDGALNICNQLRDRMYARFLRWQDATELRWEDQKEHQSLREKYGKGSHPL